MTTSSPAKSNSTASFSIALIHAQVHGDIVASATGSFVEAVGDQADVELLALPGAFELPLRARELIETGRFDAIVAVGFVVDGGIYRHEFVSSAVIDGLMRVQHDTGVPVFSCVLTPQRFHDHQDHVDFFTNHMVIKGHEVAEACLATLASQPQRAAEAIVVIDTTFASVDMGALIADRIASAQQDGSSTLAVRRVTVPGFKDLAAAARSALDAGTQLVIAAAMPGPEPIDAACASEASAGLQAVQALTGRPVLEVFVHQSEALDDAGSIDASRLSELCERRCHGHADNAIWMLSQPEVMAERAGSGRRQGGPDVGALVGVAG